MASLLTHLEDVLRPLHLRFVAAKDSSVIRKFPHLRRETVVQGHQSQYALGAHIIDNAVHQSPV